MSGDEGKEKDVEEEGKEDVKAEDGDGRGDDREKSARKSRDERGGRDRSRRSTSR